MKVSKLWRRLQYMGDGHTPIINVDMIHWDQDIVPLTQGRYEGDFVSDNLYHLRYINRHFVFYFKNRQLRAREICV